MAVPPLPARSAPSRGRLFWVDMAGKSREPSPLNVAPDPRLTPACPFGARFAASSDHQVATGRQAADRKEAGRRGHRHTRGQAFSQASSPVAQALGDAKT